MKKAQPNFPGAHAGACYVDQQSKTERFSIYKDVKQKISHKTVSRLYIHTVSKHQAE